MATLNGHVGLLASRYNRETVGTHYVLKNDGNPFQLKSLIPKHYLVRSPNPSSEELGGKEGSGE